MRIQAQIVVATSVCILMAVCLTLGFRREAGPHRAGNRGNNVNITLHYGDLAPPFQLPKLNGGMLSEQELRGKWSVLIFTQMHCPACEDALVQLQNLRPSLKNWNVVVLLAQSGFGPLSHTIAKEYVASKAITFPVVLANDSAVWKQYCDLPLVSPFTVVVDPKGKVRYAEGGFSQNSGFGLAGALQAEVEHSTKLPSQSPTPKIPDGSVIINGRKREQLSNFLDGKNPSSNVL